MEGILDYSIQYPNNRVIENVKPAPTRLLAAPLIAVALNREYTASCGHERVSKNTRFGLLRPWGIE